MLRYQHMRKVHGHLSEHGLNECPHCKKTFNGLKKLKEHIRWAHVDGQYKCKGCDMVFQSRTLRSRHMLKDRDI